MIKWLIHDDGWKILLAITYACICIFDFVVVPVWIGLNRPDIDLSLLSGFDTSVQIAIISAMTFQHEPFTLMGSGLFHLAFGALLTGSAITKNEKL
jgi:hypothetical protein